MKYPIEKLLNNETIDCHEVRATLYENKFILLHFFITHNEEDLPEFKMGYERYNTTLKDLNYDDKKPRDHSIDKYCLLNTNDQANILFHVDDISLAQKNEWTGEQPELIPDHTSLSPNSPENVTVNKNLRHVSEMADNSIYNTDDIINTPTYLAEKDTSVQYFDTLPEEASQNNQHTSHSIWTSDIHWKKYQKVSNEELLELFKKYKPYIGIKIPKELDTESNINIDMEQLFGTSFDFVRIKNNLFHEEDDNISGGTVNLS